MSSDSQSKLPGTRKVILAFFIMFYTGITTILAAIDALARQLVHDPMQYILQPTASFPIWNELFIVFSIVLFLVSLPAVFLWGKGRQNWRFVLLSDAVINLVLSFIFFTNNTPFFFFMFFPILSIIGVFLLLWICFPALFKRKQTVNPQM